MKQFFQRAIMFVVLLSIPLFFVELDLRSMKQVQWFNGYSTMFHNQNIDVIFLGSSLIAAAVREEKFAEEISVKGKPPRRALNLGEGYTTPVEYLLGLKRLVESNPHVFENATLVMPAAGGLPDARTWSDDWMFPQQPALLADYIDYPDLWTYCTKLNVPPTEKLMLLASKNCSMVAQGSLFRVAAMHEADLLAEFITSGGKPAPHKSLIVAVGGIMDTDEYVKYTRQVATQTAKTDLENQRPIDWNKTVIKDIVAYVQQHGGRVCFCYLPISSVQQVPLATAIRQADISNFEKVAAQWGCVILKPKYEAKNDECFPDLVHLARDEAYKYTQALADVFHF